MLNCLREITINSSVLFSVLFIMESSLYNCRPGFVRINLPYFMDEETVQFVLEAVKLVAKEGWKLLPQVRDSLVHIYLIE